jgi:hypothetical protein
MKKNKIIDIIFIGDNHKILDFRIKELYEYVDYFIIINHNNSNYINNDDKVKIIQSNPINFDTYDPQPYLDDIVKECLSGLDLRLEDLIMISKDNEIPDLEFLDDIVEELVFNPVILEHTVFNWTFSYVSVKKTKGTYIFDFAYYLKTYDKVKNLMKYKKENFLMTNTIKNGWCLVGFDYENYDKTLYENRIPVSFASPLTTHQLVTHDLKLPKNYEIFGKKILDRTSIKKVVITDDENIVIDDYDHLIYVGFTEEWSDMKIDEITPNVIRVTSYVPKFTLYGNDENFSFNFKLNEIKKFINYFFILDQDIIKIYLENKKLYITLPKNPQIFSL